MTKKYCDICGKEIQATPLCPSFGACIFNDVYYDLCNECNEKAKTAVKETIEQMRREAQGGK